tara:strand:+ start:1411 stop:2256 length:846 start_codon:yes stop_codon:yes gene_type:complete
MAFSFVGAQESLKGIREREREDELRQEDLALARENSLFQLALAKQKGMSDFKTSDKYMSAVGDTIKLQNKIKKAELDTEGLDFFKPILEDPFASADIMKFIDTQKKDGVDIRVSDIPSMMTIVKSNAPVQEKMDFIKVITGADLTNKDQYYKIARQINAINTTVGRTIFTDTKPGVGVDFEQKEKRQKAMVNIIQARIEPMAQGFVNSNVGTDNPRVGPIQAALLQLKRGGDDAKRAMYTLMTEFMGKEEFQKLMKDFPVEFKDAEKNPYLPPSLFPPKEL